MRGLTAQSGTFDLVRLVALTGGIGSGKSSVSSRLGERGAVIIDADAVVKDLQRPGRPVYEAMVARWGEGIVAEDGSLDRAAVAAIVFGDEAELEALNELVHPAVRTEMYAMTAAQAETDNVVVLDIPLLTESGQSSRGASAVIVVDVPPELAIERLVAHRGFDEVDAKARIASQAGREDRLALADFVIDNTGDLAALDAEVDRCWTWLQTLDPTPYPPPDDAGPG